MSDASDEDVQEALAWACEPFASVADFLGCECNCEIDEENPDHLDLIELALAAASDELSILSAHELRGICEQTVQVCLDRCSCRSRCSCGFGAAIELPGPIVSVSDVTFEGYTFDAADFVIVEDIWLAWKEGIDETWPAGKPITVTLRWGHRVDEITRRAAIELACPTVRQCIIDGRRSVGSGSVVRQGISITARDVSTTANISERAASDYPWMAKFLALYNPERSNWSPSVYSGEMNDVKVVRTLV